MKTIVLDGGSMNPPTLAHVAVAMQLAKRFDRTVVLPCGTRPDKWETNAVDATHRANMARIAFRDLGVELDLSDLERDEFTRTAELDRLWKDRLGDGWAVWHAVGSDLTAGGASGESEIQRSWKDGRRIWNDLNFAIVPRPNYPVIDADLPPHAQVLPDLGNAEASRMARDAFARGQPERAGVPEKVAEYALRYGIYSRAFGTRRQGRLVLPENPRLFMIAAAGNPRASDIVDRIGPRDTRDPHAIVAIGGDGHMLDVIGSVRPGVPIIGINAGHYGFLLNDVTAEQFLQHLAESSTFDTHLLPMLEVEFQGTDGVWNPTRHLAFNDVWLDRSNTQTAWVRVTAEGQERLGIDRLICDTVLVATPAGSTAYACNMGAPPQLLDTPVLTLAATAPARSLNWHYAIVPDDATITIEVLDPVKRPMHAVIDGRLVGPCAAMRVRRSRVSGTELAFFPGRSLGSKIARLQFPA